MSRIVLNENLPLKKDIVIEIADLRYSKHKNIIVEAIYEDILFDFSVFWTNNYSSADNQLSFKTLDENKQLKAPDYKIIARFDITKSGYLKCVSARIYDS